MGKIPKFDFYKFLQIQEYQKTPKVPTQLGTMTKDSRVK